MIQVPVVPGRVIEGVVLDQAGRAPLPGAGVWAYRLGAGEPANLTLRPRADTDPPRLDCFTAQAGADGSFRITVPPDGECLVTATIPEYGYPVPGWRKFDPEHEHGLELVLARHPRATIQFLHWNERPAAGLTVELPMSESGIRNFTTTDENGIAHVVASNWQPRTSPGTNCLLREGSRFVGAASLPEKLFAGEEPVNCCVSPADDRTLRVFDAVTHAPLQDVALSHRGVMTDPAGECAAKDYSPGVWGSLPDPTLLLAGYEPTGLSFISFGPDSIDVELEPQATVRIRLEDADGPCEGLWVELFHLDDGGFTDEDGRVRLTVEPGQPLRRIGAQFPDRTWVGIELERPFSLSLLLEKVGLKDPPPGPGLSIGAGQDLNLGTVRVDLIQNPWWMRNRVPTFLVRDENGAVVPDAFCFDAGTGQVLALGRRDGSIEVWRGWLKLNGPTRVVTAPGKAAAPLEIGQAAPGPIVLWPATPRRGILAREDGTPRVGVRVLAREAKDRPFPTRPGFWTATAITDSLGEFTLHGIPEGEAADLWEDDGDEWPKIGSIPAGQRMVRISTRD